ncbi:hypothetical protein B0H19DRAFT_492234 [Mycena capillaripes]|nr:hypothetical protein B0H19DRAFT_492234 [Mycena capillaripes]
MSQPLAPYLLALPAEILLLILSELREIHYFPVQDQVPSWEQVPDSEPSHTRASINGLRSISTVNRQIRLMCLPILFNITRCTNAERFRQLSAECMANAQFARLIRELDMVEVDTVDGLPELLPCLSSLVRLDLKAERLDARLLAVVNSKTTLVTVVVRDSEVTALRALLLTTDLSFSKILVVTTTVHRLFKFPLFVEVFCALLKRGTRFSQLIFQEEVIFDPALHFDGPLTLSDLEHIVLDMPRSPTSASLHSWLPAFAHRHTNLRMIRFMDWHSSFWHIAGLPFAYALLDALHAEPPMAQSWLQAFSVIRPAAAGWTTLDEWEVVALEMSLSNAAAAGAVLNAAAALAPRISTLELVLRSSMQQRTHIDTLAEALSALPALRTLHLTNAYAYLHAGGPTPWIAAKRPRAGRRKNWDAVGTSGCVTALDAMQWYLTRIVQQVRALEVVHIEDAGQDGRGRFGSRWALRATLRVKGDGERKVEVVGAPKLTMADKYLAKT